MLDRILEVLKQKNLSPSQFADEVGIQRSGMSHLLSGRNKPSLEVVLKILKRYPDIKTDWLLYGAAVPESDGDVKKAFQNNTPAEQTLFDVVEPIENKPEIKPTRTPVNVKSPEKKVEKIVIFYNDRSFREYEPDK